MVFFAPIVAILAGSLFGYGFGALIGLVGYGLVKSAMIREDGVETEQNSIHDLSKQLPNGWALESNVELGQGGDLDVLLTAPGGTKYAIEIKSYVCVKPVKRFFSVVGIAGCDGKKAPEDAIAQVLSAAAQVGADHAVVWLPRASGKVIMVNGAVPVVRGDEKLLRKYLGATNLFGF